MNYLMQKANNIEYFIEGISAVCNDKNLIAEKTKEHFGRDYSKLIDYLLLLETKQFNSKALAKALNNRDLEDGFYRFEIKCAIKSHLVIVTGYSDDLIELDGAINQEGNCFCGGNFHLEKSNKEWILKNEKRINNISAIWYDQKKTTDNLEIIPWSYKTDIPHESFYATYRGDPWCEGFVFRVEDLTIDIQECL